MKNEKNATDSVWCLGVLALARPSLASDSEEIIDPDADADGEGFEELMLLDEALGHLNQYKTDMSGTTDHQDEFWIALWELYKSEAEPKTYTVEALKSHDESGGFDDVRVRLLRSVLCANLAITYQKGEELSEEAQLLYGSVCIGEKVRHRVGRLRSALEEHQIKEARRKYLEDTEVWKKLYLAKARERREREAEAAKAREAEAAMAREAEAAKAREEEAAKGLEPSVAPATENLSEKEIADRRVQEILKELPPRPVDPTTSIKGEAVLKFSPLKDIGPGMFEGSPSVWGSSDGESTTGANSLGLTGVARIPIEALKALASESLSAEHHDMILLALARLLGETVQSLEKQFSPEKDEQEEQFSREEEVSPGEQFSPEQEVAQNYLGYNEKLSSVRNPNDDDEDEAAPLKGSLAGRMRGARPPSPPRRSGQTKKSAASTNAEPALVGKEAARNDEEGKGARNGRRVTFQL